MKKLISIAALAALFGGFALSADADASNKYHKTVVHKKVVHKSVVHKFHQAPKVTFKFPFPAPKFVMHAPVVYRPRVIHAPPPVIPAYTFVYDQVWCEPVYSQVITGYDSCGTPIYQHVVTTPGHYKTAKYQVYPNGQKVFVCYM